MIFVSGIFFLCLYFFSGVACATPLTYSSLLATVLYDTAIAAILLVAVGSVGVLVIWKGTHHVLVAIRGNIMTKRNYDKHRAFNRRVGIKNRADKEADLYYKNKSIETGIKDYKGYEAFRDRGEL